MRGMKSPLLSGGSLLSDIPSHFNLGRARTLRIKGFAQESGREKEMWSTGLMSTIARVLLSRAIWSKSPSVIRLELFVDILGECVSVKTATHEGPFNLQCKYLSISRREEEEQGLRRRDNGGVFQSFSFCCCCLRAGRGSSSSPVFLNCEARRLVRVLPTFHPKQRSHQIQLPSDTGFHTGKFSHCLQHSNSFSRGGKKSPTFFFPAPYANHFCPCPSDSTLNGTQQPR